MPREATFSERVELACWVAAKTDQHIRDAGEEVERAAITVFDANELSNHNTRLMVVVWDGDPSRYECFTPVGRALKYCAQEWQHDHQLRRGMELLTACMNHASILPLSLVTQIDAFIKKVGQKSGS